MISAGKATLNELQTIYSVEDTHLMLEILMVDSHNQALADRARREAAERERRQLEMTGRRRG